MALLFARLTSRNAPGDSSCDRHMGISQILLRQKYKRRAIIENQRLEVDTNGIFNCFDIVRLLELELTADG